MHIISRFCPFRIVARSAYAIAVTMGAENPTTDALEYQDEVVKVQRWVLPTLPLPLVHLHVTFMGREDRLVLCVLGILGGSKANVFRRGNWILHILRIGKDARKLLREMRDEQERFTDVRDE